MEDEYQRYFKSLPCYLTVQDREFRIVEANDMFRRDFGEFAGRHCFDVYKHREEECSTCPVRATFLDGQVHESEEVVTTNRGEPVNTLVYTAPLRDANGTVTGVMEMSTNITQVRRLQSQLASIGLLISSISHGIKGLLNSLDGGVYLVNAGMKRGDKERVDRGWEMVQRNLARVKSMVMDILYYAKDREPDWQTVEAAGAAEEARALIEPKAAEHGIGFAFRADPAAGAFEGDAKAVRSMLVNLLENSLDACRVDQKPGPHRVAFGLTGTPGHVEFSIEDNGIGMDRETREKAFSLFFSSKGSEGTGLGLFVSNKIAAAHGGAIDVDSEPARGTRFTVRIPRKRGTYVK